MSLSAEVIIVQIIVPFALALLSAVVLVSIAVVGFVFRMVFKRIEGVETTAKQMISEEERRRTDAMKSGFDDIKIELRIIRDDLKNIARQE